jgi:hypothetical protein
MRTIIVFFLIAVAANVCSAQWIQTAAPLGLTTSSFAVMGTTLFAGTSGGVYRTTDNGTLWTVMNSGLTDSTINSLAIVGSTLFAATPMGVFRSTNGGSSSWSISLSVWYTGALVSNSTALFVGTSGRGVFLSTNEGASWTGVNSGLTDSSVMCLAAGGSNLFAGTQQGVFRSTSSGASWTSVGLANVSDLAIAGSILFAATYGGSGGVFRSTDNGMSWTPANSGLTDLNVLAFGVYGTNVFAGTAFAGVFLFDNSTSSWRAVDSGMTVRYIASLGVGGTNLYAGTMTAGVWRRPVSEMIVNVAGDHELPAQFTLGQNYPNPFNPSTTIEYSVPERASVEIKVLDMLGREVAALVNEDKPAGAYTVRWNADGVASGVYFYRLKTGMFVRTRKMLLFR